MSMSATSRRSSVICRCASAARAADDTEACRDGRALRRTGPPPATRLSASLPKPPGAPGQHPRPRAAVGAVPKLAAAAGHPLSGALGAPIPATSNGPRISGLAFPALSGLPSPAPSSHYGAAARPSDRPANCRQAHAQAPNARRIAGNIWTNASNDSVVQTATPTTTMGRSPRGRTAVDGACGPGSTKRAGRWLDRRISQPLVRLFRATATTPGEPQPKAHLTIGGRDEAQMNRFCCVSEKIHKRLPAGHRLLQRLDDPFALVTSPSAEQLLLPLGRASHCG